MLADLFDNVCEMRYVVVLDNPLSVQKHLLGLFVVVLANDDLDSAKIKWLLHHQDFLLADCSVGCWGFVGERGGRRMMKVDLVVRCLVQLCPYCAIFRLFVA